LLDLDLTGLELLPDGPDETRITKLLEVSLATGDVEDGHLGLEVVDAARMAEVNSEQRGNDGPTDVLSFPVDGAGEAIGPREIGDIVLCPELCESVERAIVHAALHLVGMDHETDHGEMLAVEAEIMRWVS
jgi:probable rRNA maturation factor